MNIFVYPTKAEADNAAAWVLIKKMLTEDGIIGLATGDTTRAVFDVAAKLYAVAPFDTSKVRFSAVDDYYGIPDGHIASCSQRIREQVQKPLGLKDGQIFLPSRFSDLSETECAAAYEKLLADEGGVKTQFLGIGGDGHLGFCRPKTPFNSLAHAIKLPDDTRNMLFDKYALPKDQLPEYGISLGLMSIMRIPEIIVIATGTKKAEAVRLSLCEAPTEDVPASILQMHPNVTWILDAEAAGEL